MIQMEKKEQYSLKDLLNENKMNTSSIIDNYQREIKTIYSQKSELLGEIQTYNEALEEMKENYKDSEDKSRETEKNYRIELDKLISAKKNIEDKVTSLEKQHKKEKEHWMKKIEDYEESNEIFREEMEKMKKLVKEKIQKEPIWEPLMPMDKQMELMLST